ncbi:hypothetical protein EZS27_014884 [termite gut metagenome]|uniref:Fibronectin type-III domain-containing protein n=1 Tax=termite gut metagenome TaxID=433724 RepID=A0A5J4RTA0_9ZZZZ
MDKLLKQFAYILSFTAVMIVAGCSENIADEITTIETSRLFSPTNLETQIMDQTSVRLTWKAVSKAKSYNIEVSDNEEFTGSPVKTASVTFVEVPYTISGFEGDTEYFVRIQAVAEGITESKWISATFKTGAGPVEQILLPVDPADIRAKSVTLRWTAGETATTILLTPGNMEHIVTSGEIEAGAATIDGLTAETAYTAKLMNGNKTRGTRTFTTLIDLEAGGVIPIYSGDNLVEILTAAEEGASYVIYPGEYILSSEDGAYVLTKSVSLAGYKSGDEEVIIHGRFRFSSPVNYLSLKTLVLDGNDQTITNTFDITAGSVIGSISISGCEIRNYKTHFIYNNTSTANIGNVTISDCIISGFSGGGGDGIDIRANASGAFNSLTVENTTFNTGFRSFLRMQLTCNVAFRNCTFYRISNIGGDTNNTGLFRSSGGTLEVSKCLFVETGLKENAVAGNGNWCKNAGNMAAAPTYQKNYYYSCYNLWEGLYTNPSQCDATEADPGFKDAEKGDFTVTNEALLSEKIGDPRWLQ